MLPLQTLSGGHILLIAVLIGAIIIYRAVIRPFRQGMQGKTTIKRSSPTPSRAANNVGKSQRNEYVKSTPTADSNSPEAKGKRFEEFVVRKFQAEQFYTLKEWRGDKYVDGIYPESNKYPDLELEFTMKDIKRRFAIECKYRSRMNGQNEVEFAYEDQLKRYKQFEAEYGIPVYILLGLEGKPEAPQHLFLIPVSTIYHPVLSEEQLQQYHKESHSNFYFNLMDNTLN
jgi:hypothetical protein